MGFFDVLKKGAEIASKGMEITDKALKKAAEKASDEELKAILRKNSNNRYAKAEAEKRGI